jgi:putative cell wall-binding protein
MTSVVIAILGVPLVVATSLNDAEAASATGPFDPGYIISDSLFYDAHAMTAAEIQTFLNAKIGTCQNGKCLNVAVLPVADRPASYSGDSHKIACSAIQGGNLPVSELIYRTQVACSISAKVILVTLQKEQGLVTSRAPSDAALRKAMGQGCPDTAPCDDSFAGLGLQIISGARQLAVYKAALPNSSFRFKEPGVYNIAYTTFVDSDCTAPAVNVRNYATLALYNYTPYQPNAAALNNLYGAGDRCSSYGNRNFWVFYRDWFGDPTEVIPTGVAVNRIGGSDRFASSAAISAASFAPGVPVVYVASGNDFADAISAAPAAAHGGGPVLLIRPDGIPAVVEAEMARLAPQKIVIVGGAGAVTDGVETTLRSMAPRVDRVSGKDRYETSRAVLSYAFGTSVSAVYVATGVAFADALSASAAAGSRGIPVLLVDGSRGALDKPTNDLLSAIGVSRVYIAGGTGVVTSAIENALSAWLGTGSVVRLAGSDRYRTANAVNLERFPTAATFYIASGEEFADALGAAPVAAIRSVPLYVTPSSCMPRALVDHIISAGATQVVVIGGIGAVSAEAARFHNC